MITKSALTTAQLSRVFQKAVKPNIITDHSNPYVKALANHFRAGAYTPNVNIAQLAAVSRGALPEVNFIGRKITKELVPAVSAQISEASKVIPSSIQNKIFWKSPGALFQKLPGGPLKGKEAFTSMENIIGIHELDELKGGAKALRSLKKGKDTVLPTAHNHPDVLFKEHNILTTLEGSPEVKEQLIKKFRAVRGMNNDLASLDKTLERLGGYGTGMRLNRSMRKHLATKLRENYKT